MMVFIKLMLAHLLGDFVLQPKGWVAAKETQKLKAPQLYYHALIHGALVYLLGWVGSLENWWLPALLITVLHFAIDAAKLLFQKETSKTKWFVADQFLHLASIAMVYWLCFDPLLDVTLLLQSPLLWIFITALLFLSFAASVIIRMLLRYWTKFLYDNPDDSLAMAGRYIGILERLFVFLFIVTGHWEGVGFLLAAKSVFRFGDLKEAHDRKLTEYILIGTLLSFGMAVVTGMLVQWATAVS